MAVGPIARLIAQFVVPVVAVLARALPAAYTQALQNARKAGIDAASTNASGGSVKNMLRKHMDRSEALEILNLSESDATIDKIQEKYQKYMAANEIGKGGGSFYLQSKVYRAKELLDQYEAEKQQQNNNYNNESNNDQQQQKQ